MMKKSFPSFLRPSFLTLWFDQRFVTTCVLCHIECRVAATPSLCNSHTCFVLHCIMLLPGRMFPPISNPSPGEGVWICCVVVENVTRLPCFENMVQHKTFEHKRNICVFIYHLRQIDSFPITWHSLPGCIIQESRKFLLRNGRFESPVIVLVW